MDTSEAELGVISSEADSDVVTLAVDPGVVSSEADSRVVTSGDKIYQGINFTALKNELTIQKLWRERTWKGILRHFFIALIFGTLGSFIDIGTDGLTAKSFIKGANYTKWVKNLSEPENHDDCVHTGRFTSFNPGPKIDYEEIVCFEQDPMWGWATVALIFFPGLFSAYEVSRIIMDARGKRSYFCHLLLYACLAFPCLIIFPVVLIIVKVVCLINPGPEWKRTNTRITGIEGSWESKCQTILTLFIIFTRADRQPSSVQIASLVASLAMITKTSIAEYLSPKQPLKLKDELKATAILLPLFLSNAVFKVLSVAITFTCLRYIAFAVVGLVFFGDLVLMTLQKKASCCSERFTLLDEDHRIAPLHVRNDIIWGFSNLIVLTSSVIAANINPDSLNYTVTDLGFLNYLEFSNNSTMQNESDINISRIQSSQISKRPGLVDNLPLLNGLYVGILAAMAINATLFYFQMWKPLEEEELVEQRTSDELV